MCISVWQMPAAALWSYDLGFMFSFGYLTARKAYLYCLMNPLMEGAGDTTHIWSYRCLKQYV